MQSALSINCLRWNYCTLKEKLTLERTATARPQSNRMDILRYYWFAGILCAILFLTATYLLYSTCVAYIECFPDCKCPQKMKRVPSSTPSDIELQTRNPTPLSEKNTCKRVSSMRQIEEGQLKSKKSSVNRCLRIVTLLTMTLFWITSFGVSFGLLIKAINARKSRTWNEYSRYPSICGIFSWFSGKTTLYLLLAAKGWCVL